MTDPTFSTALAATPPPPPAPLPRRRLRADLPRVLRPDLAPAHDQPRREHVGGVGRRQLPQRLSPTHKPEYLGWVHDSGLTFRHERYPAYKATREKLTEELQDDFDRGMERICQLLEAYRIPILSLHGLRGRRRHRHARAPGRRRRA